jgi:hypothetical protein
MPAAPHPFDPSAPAASAWLPAAVLHHATGPTAHHDLLLATQLPAGPDDPVCATWRVTEDPRSLAPGQVAEAVPLSPHRALYLQLDTSRTLDRGRGTVTPVDAGRWRHAGAGTVEVAWDGAAPTTYALDAAPAPSHPPRLRRIDP